MKCRTNFFLCLLVLSACGGGGGGPSEKDLFSNWRHTESDFVLDLSNGDFNEPIDFSIFFSSGSQCDCTFRVTGSQSSGVYVINSCTYLEGSGAGDPNCNSLNESGTYTKENNILTVEGPSGTVVYE